MRVLVVGGGAREHALCWRLRGHEVWASPGNPGTDAVARRVAADVVPPGPDLVVIGPEAPLVAGLADRLRGDGVPVLGPSAAAARIEGSKSWAMDLCRRSGIPAPRAVRPADPLAAARSADLPVVVKADGLMAGKGVVIAHTRREAEEAARTFAAHGPVVFEEFLQGREVSAFALADGSRAVFYGLARDHKRLQDGNRGPMTGGMGAYSPVTDVSPAERRGCWEILQACLDALAREGSPYVGFLFAGLMLTADGPKVLEFNCRLGDPEAQVLLPLLEGDVLGQWRRAAAGRLDAGETVSWGAGSAVGVVLASPGYPSAPRPGQEIAGLDAAGQAPDVLVFHAATARNGVWRTAGGRVLTLVGRGPDLASARSAAYAALDRVTFAGAQVRGDVGATTPPA